MTSTSISVITVAKNAALTISDCISSVQNQDHPAEHIVIDGASTDDTLDQIRHFEGKISRIVSEPDLGIYDAMNKGLDLATGDIVGILNADDFYAHPHVISKVATAFEDPGIDACYGDLVYVNRSGLMRVARVWRSRAYDKALFYKGWMPPHPTFFTRRRVYEEYGNFDPGMGTAADYELVLRFLLRHQIRAAHIPDILVVMRSGGLSNASFANRLIANVEDRRAWRRNGLRPRPWTLFLKPASKLCQYVIPHLWKIDEVHRWWDV